MKKLSTLVFAACFLPVLANAQVVITNIQPGFGDQFTVHQQADFELDPGPSGPNVVWDFSDMGMEYIVDFTVVHPAQAIGSQYFPESTMVWEGNLQGIVTMSKFYSFENGEMIDYGAYTETDEEFVTNINADSLTVFNFPIHYQDTGSDTYSGTLAIDFFISMDFFGTHNYEVDAYGSITTPLGSFSNALRIKVIQAQNPGPLSLFETIFTDYHWYVPEYPMPVLVISRTESFFMGEPDEIEYYNSYLADYNFVSGISTKDLPLVNLFPNPAQNTITIQSDFEGQAVLNIYTVEGKKADQHNIRNNETIDISGLIPGFYIAEVVVGDRSYSRAQFAVVK